MFVVKEIFMIFLDIFVVYLGIYFWCFLVVNIFYVFVIDVSFGFSVGGGWGWRKLSKIWF